MHLFDTEMILFYLQEHLLMSSGCFQRKMTAVFMSSEHVKIACGKIDLVNPFRWKSSFSAKVKYRLGFLQEQPGVLWIIEATHGVARSCNHHSYGCLRNRWQRIGRLGRASEGRRIDTS